MTAQDTVPRTGASPGAGARPRAGLGDRLLRGYTWLVLIWLFLPVVVMIAFGFNDTKGRINITWQGFTFQWYERLFEIPDLTAGLWNSLLIAVLTMIIATAIGTPAGLALGRFRFRGEGVLNLVIFAAISAPEIVMGTSLLSLFLQAGTPLGYVSLTVAHVMFCVSFVAVTVRARVLTLDPSLEEAARDLGAGPWETFRLVTLPLIMPGVTAGALLSFALSIDDFIISSFVNGSTITFPLWVYGASRLGIPPQVNVMGTLIFVIGVALTVLMVVSARRRAA